MSLAPLLELHLNGKLQFPPALLLNLFDQTSLLTTFRGFPFAGTLLRPALFRLFGKSQLLNAPALDHLGEAQLLSPVNSLLFALFPGRSRAANRIGNDRRHRLNQGLDRTFFPRSDIANLISHVRHGFGNIQILGISCFVHGNARHTASNPTLLRVHWLNSLLVIFERLGGGSG
jgi:hypothetical protein